MHKRADRISDFGPKQMASFYFLFLKFPVGICHRIAYAFMKTTPCSQYEQGVSFVDKLTPRNAGHHVYWYSGYMEPDIVS